MTQVELPDDVAAEILAAQQAMADSVRESQEALTAQADADRAVSNAQVQMTEANVAATRAQERGLAAMAKLGAYLKLPASPTP